MLSCNVLRLCRLRLFFGMHPVVLQEFTIRCHEHYTTTVGVTCIYVRSFTLQMFLNKREDNVFLLRRQNIGIAVFCTA